MAASFRCPKCGTAFRVDDTMLGKAVICPNQVCRQKSILPKSSANDSPKPLAKVPRSTRARYSSRETAAANQEEATSQVTRTRDDRHQMSQQTLVLIAAGVAAFMFAAIVGLLVFQRLSVPRVASVDQVPSDPDENASKEDASQTPKLPDPLPPEPSEAPVAESKQMKEEPLGTTAESRDSSGPSVAEEPSPKLLTVEQVVAKVEASVACIKFKGYIGGGSGFVIREGMIATNRHVIEKVLISQLEIHFPSAPMDQRGPFPAELIYVDPEKDLAFLKVPTSIAPLTTVQTHTFRRGQEVIAIGSPGAFARTPQQMTLQNAVSQGVVSTEAMYEGQRYYQLSIAINHGNSGGPVFDMTGNVIGVVTLKDPDPDKDGLGFCITPQDLSITLAHVDALTDEEIKTNRSRHRLGVLVRAISKLTRKHGRLMELYLVSMEIAVNDGKSAEFGLQMARGELDAVVRELNAENAAVDSELTNEASLISSDEHLPERIREQFSALWTNYKEIRSNVENPRGTMDAFRTKKLQLTDTHERLMHSLNLHLSIKE
jgi:S1-C subfamily serine protease